MFNLILALIAVESGGNNLAVGDHGQSHGPLQIQRVVIQDVNRIYKTNYKYSDRFNRNKSIQICQLYLRHYASKKRLGRNPTYQDMARIWVAGPDGWRQRESLPYWRKVRLHL